MSYQGYNSPLSQNKNNTKRKKSDTILTAPDKHLLIIVTFLVIIGFLAIFSATAPKCMREGVSLVSFLVKQLIFAGVGFFSLAFFTNFDYHKLEKFNGKFLFFCCYFALCCNVYPVGFGN